MTNILITGSAGFIGFNLTKDLLSKKGYKIIGIDNFNDYYDVNLKKRRNKILKKFKNYKFFKIDINNDKKILKIFKRYKPNAIFNLAAETHVDRSIDGPESFIKSNILGVFKLLQAFRKFVERNKNSLLIHISTDEVYGDVLTGRSKEEDAYKPSSPYAASKASSDHLVYSYIRTFKIPAIITNCSNNYGPRQHPEKLIPKLIYNILNNKNLPIYGKGKNSREWIYVDDHCEALIKIFKKGKIGNFYNIGSNINVNNINLMKKLLKIIKTTYMIGDNVKIKFVSDRPGHDLRYAINSNKLKTKLNWKPKINLAFGLKKTFEWYYENQKYFLSLNKRDIVNRLGKKR